MDVTSSKRTTESHFNKQHTSTNKNLSPYHRNAKHNRITHKETTQLRALVGSLQWPSTQSAPHLQCAASQLAGKVSKGTVSSLELGNKVLRMAKSNADVGLHYHALGSINGITFLVFSDATYASRDNLSSQGGYLLCMGHHNVINDRVGSWPEWPGVRCRQKVRLPLSADALLFTCLFWNLLLPLEDSSSAQLQHRPAHVIDAKALYDLLT